MTIIFWKKYLIKSVLTMIQKKIFSIFFIALMKGIGVPVDKEIRFKQANP